jgi:hypothetical protein
MVDVVSLNSPFDEQPDAFASTVNTPVFTDEDVVDDNIAPMVEQAYNTGDLRDVVSQPYYGLTQDQRKTYAEEGITKATPLLASGPFIPDESILARFTTGTATTEDQQKLQETQQSIFDNRMAGKFGLIGEEDFSTNTSEIYKEAYKNLSSLKTEDPEQFVNVFSGLTSQPRLAYLYKELQAGNINDEEYAETALNVLRQENPSRPYFTDNGKVYTWPTEDTDRTPYEVMLRPNEVWNMPAGDEVRQEDYFLDHIGRMGKHTDDFDESFVGGFLNSPIVSIAGMANPIVALATTATKAAIGMKLSPMEIASSLLTGLEMAGVVKPPTPVDAPVDTPVGNTPSQLPQGTKPPDLGGIVVGGKPPQMTKGTGLFGSSYAETQMALNVAAAGDVKGAAIALVGDNLIKEGLDKIGLDRATIEDTGIQYDDFQAGIGKTVKKLAAGEELDEALAHGLGKYIREGGTLGSIDLPSVDLGIDVDGLSEFIGPIADKLSEVETAVRQGLSEFDKEVLQPSTKPIGDTLSAAETEVRQGLSTLDKEVLQPITQPIGDIVEDVGQAVGDVASDLDTAVRQALPNTSIDLPSVDLPNLDFPNLGLNPSLGSTGMLELKYPSATRTTDALFNDELFKFKNKIEPTKERLEYIDLNEPVENFFEDTINERLPRSYMF